MRTTTSRALIANAAVVLFLGAMPLMAQEPRPGPAQGQAQAQAQQPKSAQGQLVRVDADASTLSIQSAQGAPMVFRYNNDTKVIGAEKGVAGLATMSGAAVTVQYVERDKDNIATQIEIRAKQ
jgi:hypothetical protein